MEPDDLLDTLAYSAHHCGARPCVWCSSPSRPCSHPILWPLRWVGWGLGADPPGPPSGPSCITPSCSIPAAVFFFIHVIGWSGDVLILDSYQESPCESSSATHPRGTNPFLIGTQSARLDYDYACKYTCSIFLLPFYHNTYIVSIFRPGVWKICDCIVAFFSYVLLKGRRRSH